MEWTCPQMWQRCMWRTFRRQLTPPKRVSLDAEKSLGYSSTSCTWKAQCLSCLCEFTSGVCLICPDKMEIESESNHTIWFCRPVVSESSESPLNKGDKEGDIKRIKNAQSLLWTPETDLSCLCSYEPI